ncbi:MAG: 3-hydroxyacyl-CoA dehydrogenase NAD-binding domain-containing protein, partial [Hyphomicrobiales bacterium]
MNAKPVIASAGAGRMGRGIAIVFAFAGYDVRLIDMKARSAGDFARLCENATSEVSTTLAQLADFQMVAKKEIEEISGRVTIHPCA